jgi:aconitate hydratase
MEYPEFKEPEKMTINEEMLVRPGDGYKDVSLEKGPNIKELPEFDPLPDGLEGPVLLKVQDDISTDEIMPAGTRVLPFRSNIPEISKFVFDPLDESFYERARANQYGNFFIVAGKNYGQGSSREHASIAPRHLGLRAVLAKGYARIHAQNLINFGMLPLVFKKASDWDKIDQGDILQCGDLKNSVQDDDSLTIENKTKNESYKLDFKLNMREREMIMNGSLLNLVREKKRKV